MKKIKLLNVVILTEDYEKMIDWYKEVLELDTILVETGSYNYTELGREKNPMIGFAPAKEMKHTAHNPKQNSVMIQFMVESVEYVLERVKATEATVLFGPSKDEKYNFFYGAFSDPEGNQVWVVDEACP